MTQDSTAERRRARMAFMDDKKRTQAMTAPIIYIRQEHDTAHAGTWCDVPDGGAPYVPQAAIAAAMMGGVKPLKWDDHSDPHRLIFHAVTPFGKYYIQQSFFPEPAFVVTAINEIHITRAFDFVAAKAAAQADYQARILSALSITADAMAALAAVKALAAQICAMEGIE